VNAVGVDEVNALATTAKVEKRRGAGEATLMMD